MNVYYVETDIEGIKIYFKDETLAQYFAEGREVKATDITNVPDKTYVSGLGIWHLPEKDKIDQAAKRLKEKGDRKKL